MLGESLEGFSATSDRTASVKGNALPDGSRRWRRKSRAPFRRKVALVKDLPSTTRLRGQRFASAEAKRMGSFGRCTNIDDHRSSSQAVEKLCDCLGDGYCTCG